MVAQSHHLHRSSHLLLFLQPAAASQREKIYSCKSLIIPTKVFFLHKRQISMISYQGINVYPLIKKEKEER